MANRRRQSCGPGCSGKATVNKMQRAHATHLEQMNEGIQCPICLDTMADACTPCSLTERLLGLDQTAVDTCATDSRDGDGCSEGSEAFEGAHREACGLAAMGFSGRPACPACGASGETRTNPRTR